MLKYKASKKFKLIIATKALVMPQAGQKMPVTDLKIQATGRIDTIYKKNIKIINIIKFLTLFIFKLIP